MTGTGFLLLNDLDLGRSSTWPWEESNSLSSAAPTMFGRFAPSIPFVHRVCGHLPTVRKPSALCLAASGSPDMRMSLCAPPPSETGRLVIGLSRSSQIAPAILERRRRAQVAAIDAKQICDQTSIAAGSTAGT